MRITCPHCGARDVQEFVVLGDAMPVRPQTPVEQPLDEATMSGWHDYVYLRENPAGAHRELWYHQAGCRQWLVVTRDVRTHEISGPIVHASAQGLSQGSSVLATLPVSPPSPLEGEEQRIELPREATP